MNRNRLGLGTMVPVWLLSAACSSSSATPAKSTQTSDDASASTTSDGSTASGTEPTGDGATGSTAPPVVCGGVTCSAPSGGALPLASCCLSDDGCGATFDTTAIPAGFVDASFPDAGALACFDTSPGTADPSCPSQSAMGYTLAGCCTKAGTCGFDLSVAGLGCNSLSALGPLGGFGGDAAAPQACSGDASAPAPDAGSAASDAAPE